jgi:hypothetical protein
VTARLPVVQDGNGFICPAREGDLVQAGHVLSADEGQQLAAGTDGGLLAKGLATQEALDAVTGSRAALSSPGGTRPADLAADAIYAVPPYRVGGGQLLVFACGVFCAGGQQYEEVGETGTQSTSIRLLIPVARADSLNVIVL